MGIPGCMVQLFRAYFLDSIRLDTVTVKKKFHAPCSNYIIANVIHTIHTPNAPIEHVLCLVASAYLPYPCAPCF